MAALRHPWCSASQARKGRKTSWPVAPAAVRMPVTRPRRSTNQRPVTVATSPIDMAPVPIPTTIPQHSTSCHDCVIQTGNRDPTLTRTSATAMTRWMPRRSMRAAENGAASPKRTRLTETATADDAHGPAELVVQRRHEHARRRPESRRPDDRQERDGGDPPRGVDARASAAEGSGAPWAVSSDAECRSVRLTGQDCGIREPSNEWPDGHHVQGSGHEALAAGRPHLVVVLALDTAIAFEIGLPHRFLRAGALDPGWPGPPTRRGPALRRAPGDARRRSRHDLGRVCRPADPPERRGRPSGHHRRAGHQRRHRRARRAARASSSRSPRPPARARGGSRSAPARSSSRPSGSSTAARPRRTGATSTLSAGTSPQVLLNPDVLYVDHGDVLTSAGNAAGIDLLLHVLRSDLGTEAANRVARGAVVAPWRAGGQAQFIDRPVPDESDAGTGATRAWALEHLDEPIGLVGPGPSRRDERAHLHPALPRGDRRDGGHLAVARSRRPGPPPARDDRPARRPRRRRRRLRHQRVAAPAPRGRRRPVTRSPTAAPTAPSRPDGHARQVRRAASVRSRAAGAGAPASGPGTTGWRGSGRRRRGSRWPGGSSGPPPRPRGRPSRSAGRAAAPR